MFKLIHIIGIGGIGMSALAEIAHRRGVQVQGSDKSDNANIKRLKALGIQIFAEHKAHNIKQADCIVYSSAIAPDNPERAAALQSGQALWHRADMLSWLMENKRTITISGTHGKTTTTALVGAILDEAALDPTIINGGIMHQYKSNVRFGTSDWMVVEGDESDGTFTKLPSEFALITNIDKEHLSHYGRFDNLLAGFQQFIDGARRAIIPRDDALSARLAKPRATQTYALSQASAITHSAAGSRWQLDGTAFSLCLLGEHNIRNALAAITLARALGIDDGVSAAALAKFQGIGRRFTFVGKLAGARLYDDYAHHPKEIAETIKAAKKVCAGKVAVIVQPHRYSRLQDLFDEFVSCLSAADIIALTPVYAAGEPAQTPDDKTLAEALRSQGREVAVLESPEAIKIFIQKQTKRGDMVIAMGAGSIGAWLRSVADVA